MIIKRISLNESRDDVYLDAYIADKTLNFKRKAILVIPGGGYSEVCFDREGEPVAQAFIPYGYNAFVLTYSVRRTARFPEQLIEASRAMKHIRDNAEEYGIDPEKVFVTGFSAGGHLCAALGTMWHIPAIYEAIDMEFGYNRPTGIMPIYPVISGVDAARHFGSFKNMLCTSEPTEAELISVSIEKNVDEHAVPAFIMHTSNDEIVSVRNSLLLAEAYNAVGKQFELHIYPDAPHGIATANAITSRGRCEWEKPEIAKWVAQATAWAEAL